MRKKFTIIVVAIGIFALATSEIMLSDDGRGEKVMYDDGISGHSGYGTAICTECHTGTANSGGGKVVITSPDMPNFKYKPGQQYSIIVTITDSKAQDYGLDFAAINSAKANVGTFTVGTGLKILNNEVTHQVVSTSNSITFKWTAPATAPSGRDITFYVASVAGNKNGANTGDQVYTSKQVVTLDNTGVEEVNKSLSDFVTYPNPASGSLNVSYNLTKADAVSIKLVALNGQKVADLLSESQNSGYHKQLLELPVLSPGFYLLSITYDGATNYKKVFIIK